MDDLLKAVMAEIRRRGMNQQAAAREIGVTVASLQRHAAGAYVRSDSAAKYRSWLAGHRPTASVRSAKPEASDSPVQSADLCEIVRPVNPWNVVDLFAGCGGMSLGFDLLGAGKLFESVIALDIEKAMVDTYNDNRPRPVAVSADLAEFTSESEIRAFYMYHLATTRGDSSLARKLNELSLGGLEGLRRTIATIDRKYSDSVSGSRSSSDWRALTAELHRTGASKQTAVLGFHRVLGLPQVSDRDLKVNAIWSGAEPLDEIGRVPSPAKLRAAMLQRWDAELDELRKKSRGTGRGQLASSAHKIARFIKFVDSGAMDATRDVWVDWSSKRLGARLAFFEVNQRAISELYDQDGIRADVLLGGPPCQGFSRIGRGKIRSLRETGVHVQVDDEVGDERNRLLESYVLCVAALAPRVFLFENVRHFQAEVRTPNGTFLATEALEQSIRDVSDTGLAYSTASRIIRAHEHGVPQTRERYFMAGVRDDVMADAPNGAKWLLDLPRLPIVSLARALEGLPPVRFIDEPGASVASRADSISRPDAVDEYTLWVSGTPPWPVDKTVDGHVARRARSDDAQFFRLLGPGRRWMDYRCDNSETLRALASVVDLLTQARREVGDQPDLANDNVALQLLQKIDLDLLQQLVNTLDGSLTLRLLLENMKLAPGELHHHLATDSYLAKREGNHGDWIARLDPGRPCKTIMSHMGKDTYAYVHPWEQRTISVREAARVQSFPDWFRFGSSNLVDAFRVIGNAVPPLLSSTLAGRVAQVLSVNTQRAKDGSRRRK